MKRAISISRKQQKKIEKYKSMSEKRNEFAAAATFFFSFAVHTFLKVFHPSKNIKPYKLRNIVRKDISWMVVHKGVLCACHVYTLAEQIAFANQGDARV